MIAKKWGLKNDQKAKKEVSSIANLFQQGYFDGMTDTYTRVPIKVSCAGAKYVFVDRELSSEYQGKLLPILQEHHAPHYRGDGIERYARWQIGEAELLLHGIAYEEMEQRISERINAVLALETIAQ
ncbi:MAG: hypothetical protein GX964_10575 [Syntrophomonadaceae bacterium]|nr:hypothetical protein [Syntrophomonadaceae bacterium]